MAEKKWIDLETEEGGFLKDAFIMATVLAGANSVPKIMAVNYLSQFEDLNGEFATRPVFVPDFQIGIIPYSLALIELYNNVTSRLAFNDYARDGQDLTRTCSQRAIDNLVKEGAQLSRLYQKNQKNMERFKDNDKGLFSKVRECYFRDEAIISSLVYRVSPLTTAREDADEEGAES